jgi:diadenosine tetraphosphate (Ap4A) HIT family hydrolase
MVVPSLGQLVEGHLLIIPKQHGCALADLPPDALGELVRLKTTLVKAIRSHYGTCVLFEHGARTETSGGCGISHAHLHVVPLPAEKDPRALLEVSFRHHRVNGIADLASIEKDCPYLYYEDASGGSRVLYPAFLPSQYMRRVLAKALGNQNWDWRNSGREEAVLVTRERAWAILAEAGTTELCAK